MSHLASGTVISSTPPVVVPASMTTLVAISVLTAYGHPAQMLSNPGIEDLLGRRRSFTQLFL